MGIFTQNATANTAMKSETVVNVRGLLTQFGSHVVHDHLDFDVNRGEIMGLVGGSGSGKSVLMRSIIGLNKPQAGEIYVAGKPVHDDEKPPIGVLFQHGALFSGLTVEENIMVPLREQAHVRGVDARDIARLKIALVGLPPEAATKYPSELSGGMIKRAGLARALALDPPLLFLDEPTAGLDPIAASDFDNLVLELQRSIGMTVLLITHDLDTLFSVCGRIAVLVDKKIKIDTLAGHQASHHAWIKSYFHGARARQAMAATGGNGGER